MMMLKEPLWTSSELDIVFGRRSERPWYADGVQIDSRQVLPGDLFVALSGTAMDGHMFVEEAIERGAVAAIVSDMDASPMRHANRLIPVADTRHALVQLADMARTRAPAQVIGVTGSAGKTSTVQALKKALEASGPAHASILSYNNHVGVPLSLTRMPRYSRYGVFEMGMSHAGEIDARAKEVRPDVAVITTVGAAHLENFESTEGIAYAKSEILRHVTPGGCAVVGIDHPHHAIIAAEARAVGVDLITVSSRSQRADIKVTAINRHAMFSTITADIRGVSITYRVGLPGDAWVLNSLLVLGAVQAVGADLGQAGLALARLEAEAGRGRIHQLEFSQGRITLIDDSYNANPVSMSAALKRLALMELPSGGRRLAVLADMRELGFDARLQHESLAPGLRAADVDRVYALGAHMEALGEKAGVDVDAVTSLDGLSEQLSRTLRDGDVVLVKGSNGAGLSRLVSDLIEESNFSAAVAGRKAVM